MVVTHALTLVAPISLSAKLYTTTVCRLVALGFRSYAD